MRFTLTQSLFLDTIQQASHFVSTKLSSPILAGIYISVTDSGVLTVRSSSGQALFEKTIAAEVEEPGSAIVSAQTLVSVLKTLGPDNISVATANEQLEIVQKHSSFSLALMTATEFPPLSESIQTATAKDWKKMPMDFFAQAAKQVLIAASADETKPVLTALAVELSQPNALVTTDGFRLFRRTIDLSLNEEGTLLIPARSLRDFLAITEKEVLPTIDVLWNKEKTTLAFRWSETTLELHLIQGDFPPYRNIIPQASNFAFRVTKEDLEQALKQVMILAKETSNIVVFAVEGKELILSTQKSVRGRSRTAIPLHHLEGQPVRFGCNGRYVVDYLNSVEEEEVMIQGTESLKPVILSVPDDQNRLYLIMPFKLQDES
jgi:DNA polymerase-3 subunit beta